MRDMLCCSIVRQLLLELLLKVMLISLEMFQQCNEMRPLHIS